MSDFGWLIIWSIAVLATVCFLCWLFTSAFPLFLLVLLTMRFEQKVEKSVKETNHAL